ncbi:11341_t:CDS:1 [Diversispora eburnea]|uniref:11341_t:CDS:1 n=1 Tax=Diversispora eburnea TaxID=1213867 RepID=A0A9N8WLA4_9GLOM|nr:11341_t:CDS:1 [Diversispora eburnea]
MAGLQNSNNKNKHFTDSSNTNPALTTASTTHYSKPPTTPTSPALSTSNTTTKSPDNISSSESPRNNNKSSTVSNTTTTTTTNTSNSNNNNSSSSSNSNSPAGPRSLVPTTTHSAFSPYSQHPTSVPQHPTPVTTPTNTTITTKNSQPNSSSSSPSLSNTTMMSASHLDNSGSTLIYPQHAHFTNPTTHSFWPWGFSGGNPAGTAANGTTLLPTTGGSAFVPAVGYGAGSNMAPTHNPRPKLTTTIWEDEGTLCYQVDARGICVARRQGN